MPAKQCPKGGVRLRSKKCHLLLHTAAGTARCTTLTRKVRVPSIIALAGEAGQHVMYHYRRSAGKERWRGVVTGLRLLGVAQQETVCGTIARSVAFHRVEGRVCDPRSRACVRQPDRKRWTPQRTGTDRGDGRVLESSVCDWIHLPLAVLRG